jgi:hypothetical protein
MCRFCIITDLGILYFYFSSKNCSSKVYTSLGKVVVLVSLSTTKLSLQFSDFSVMLYDFSKSQLKHTKEGESFHECPPGKIRRFTTMPSLCAQTPEKKTCEEIESLALVGSGPHRNPARPAAEQVGEVRDNG